MLDFTDGIQFERVAALRPDLILGVYSGLTQKDYDTLSKIAPTVAQPPGQVDWGSSWQDEILTVGKAVGKPEEAERLRDKAEGQLAAAAKAHPEFKGMTAAIATPYQGIYVYGPQDARSRFSSTSVQIPARAAEHRRQGGVRRPAVGREARPARPRDADVVRGSRPRGRSRQNPIYSKLKVHTEGRDVFMGEKGELYEATSFISVLSIPLLIDQLVPKLAAAADGDAKTDPNAA